LPHYLVDPLERQDVETLRDAEFTTGERINVNGGRTCATQDDVIGDYVAE
jgi:hypothetical protein